MHLTGKVVGTHEASQWSDRRRRITVELEGLVRVTLPDTENKFRLGEWLEITVKPVVENYGSEVLRTIPISEDL
jgi:hypothetical protein